MFNLNTKLSTNLIFTKTIVNPRYGNNLAFIIPKYVKILTLGCIVLTVLPSSGWLLFRLNSTDYASWSLNSTTSKVNYTSTFETSTSYRGYFGLSPSLAYDCYVDLSVYIRSSADISGSLQVFCIAEGNGEVNV